MKTNYIIASILLHICISCSNPEPEPTIKEQNIDLIVNKSGGWSLESILVPINTATDEDDWTQFNVTFSSSNMTAKNQAAGATAVWPSGGWSMNDSGNEITRSADNVKMKILSVSASSLRIMFTVPDNVHINGRLAALGGDYTFNMK